MGFKKNLRQKRAWEQAQPRVWRRQRPRPWLASIRSLYATFCSPSSSRTSTLPRRPVLVVSVLEFVNCIKKQEFNIGMQIFPAKKFSMTRLENSKMVWCVWSFVWNLTSRSDPDSKQTQKHGLFHWTCVCIWTKYHETCLFGCFPIHTKTIMRDKHEHLTLRRWSRLNSKIELF